MTEQELRIKMVEIGKKLTEENLVQGTWGNISVRLDDTFMLVTASGLDYATTVPEDMVKVNMHTLEYEGNRKPSAERKIHAQLLRNRADVNAVIHTHSLYCSVYAASHKRITVDDTSLQKVLGKKIEVAKYGLPGTKALTKHTLDALGNNFACTMANHGMLCCGKDLDSTFETCKVLEAYAKNTLE